MPKLSIAQMAAELALKSKPKKIVQGAKQAKKPTKAENIEMGLYHPIGGGKKLKRPISEMGIKSVDDPNMPLVPNKTIKYEDMLGGAGVPLTVDRSRAGKLIQEVGGNPLIREAPTQGGIDYTRWNEAFASLPNVAERYGKQIIEASKMKGVDPDKIFGLSNLMSHEAIDFSHQPMEVLLNQFDPTLLDKKRVKEFNTTVQNHPVVNQKTKNITYPFKNFAGIETPEGRYQLLETSNYGGELRKNVMHKMNLDEFADMQFPSIAEARTATTEPRIMDAPTATVGHNIARFNPEGIVTYETDKPHYSYTGVIQGHPTLGGYAGEAEQTLPMHDIFQQYFDIRRALNKPESSDFRALSMSIPIQKFDEEWLERVKKAQEVQNKSIKEGSYKDGGQVQNLAEGGKPTVTIEGVRYEPEPIYTDPMGATIPSQDEMLYELSKQNMSPMPQSEPYRDPITGAIVKNALEALPPGDNAPQSGGMTPIDYDNLPKEEKPSSFGDKFAGAVEAGTTIGTSAGAFMAGLPYAFAKGLGGRDFNQNFEDVMNEYTYIPRSKEGLDYLESIGKGLEATKLPAILPELHGLEPIIGAGTKALMKKGVNAPVGMSIKDVSGFSPKDKFGFYSKLEKEAKNIQRKQGNGQAFKNDLLRLGVKPDELEATGMDEFLKKNPKLTKEDVVGYAERNRPVFKEIELGGDYSDNLAKFEDQFRTPGGEGYHEILLQYPSELKARGHKGYDDIARRLGAKDFASLPMEQRHEIARLAQGEPFKEWNHFPDEENIMAILRMDTRTDTEGKRGMLLDELQSDWHQKGREKGYIPKNPTSLKGEISEVPSTTFKAGTMERSPPTYKVKWEDGTIYSAFTKEQAEELLKKGKPNIPKGSVPDAPYKDNWYEIGLKKAIQHLILDTDDDRLYLPKGQTVADRYNLEKHFSNIDITRNPSEMRDLGFELVAKTHSGQNVTKYMRDLKDLEDHVGKDMAKKIKDDFANKSGNMHSYSGLDLRVGGEGMNEWYDKKYLSYLKKFANKYGGHVGETEIETGQSVFRLVDENGDLVHSKEFGTMRDAQRNIWGLKSNGLVPQDTQIKEMKGATKKVYYYEPSEEAKKKILGGLPYKDGGVVKMAGGGSIIKKATQNAIKTASSGKVGQLANKDLLTLQDYHTSLSDEIRARAKETANKIAQANFKYNVGDRVFTDWTAKNNYPPYEIVGKRILGGKFGSILRDPTTGKFLRDENGAPLREEEHVGYVVKHEFTPNGETESVSHQLRMPETAFKGLVEPEEPYKKGGVVKMAEGGEAKKFPTPEFEALYKELTSKPKNPATQSVNERLGREPVKLPYQPPEKAKPTVALRPIEVGGSRIPSTQLELFKKKGGKVVSLDEMRLALIRNK